MPKEDKRYYIDPGIGEKRSTCPYSCFEDGRDAKQDIIPPKGYVLKGFRFDPHSSDKYYDGKLVAEYERAPFMTLLKQNRSLIRILLLIIVALVALLLIHLFSNPKPKRTPTPRPIVVADTLSDADAIVTQDTDVSTVDAKPSNKDSVVSKPSNASEENKANPQPEKVAEPENVSPQSVKEPAAPLDGPNAEFREKFWQMIHSRNGQMDAYTKLYTDYKGSVKGKEYTYLLDTILKNPTSFKDWKNKLQKIPAENLATINTIDELTHELNKYN